MWKIQKHSTFGNFSKIAILLKYLCTKNQRLAEWSRALECLLTPASRLVQQCRRQRMKGNGVTSEHIFATASGQHRFNIDLPSWSWFDMCDGTWKLKLVSWQGCLCSPSSWVAGEYRRISWRLLLCLGCKAGFFGLRLA